MRERGRQGERESARERAREGERGRGRKRKRDRGRERGIKRMVVNKMVGCSKRRQECGKRKVVT